jgi:hypothetical protein
MYGSENWSLNRSERKIEAAEMRFLRPMAGYALLDKKEVATQENSWAFLILTKN